MKCGFLEGIAYKENFLTGLMANFVQVVVFYYVWKSIFFYHAEINGYTWNVMKNMFWFLFYVIVLFRLDLKCKQQIVLLMEILY